ncbi:hypothetical protein [Alloactinosynnema sp. L-07]|uniref:hypothetical protein n=1 Tax=Alloactinosynnema sp. L-07 TaxID=1653480 RepID=UPI00065F04FB|nr:hypothetical protein [Alloactinosynnema sp. L-07]CRK57759.1 hypothetical protein [Alloactinosynnema sp. L-07]
MIDLHTREVVGHAIAEHMRACLVSDAITLATQRGRTGPDARRRGARSLMGRVGSCCDNVVAESFFAPSKPRSAPKTSTAQTTPDEPFSLTSPTTATTVYIRHSATGPHETRISYSPHVALAA